MRIRNLFIISCMLVISACGTGSQTADPMRVTVTDGQGNRIANATVVVGNQAGAVASFASTDDRGEAHFGSAPPNATVTAAFSCTGPLSNRTYHYVDIAYAVNVSALTLTVGTCAESSQGSVNVNVTDTVAGITSHDVTLGPITYGGSGSSFTMDFDWSVQDDGNISVVAVGYDDADNIKGYGFTLDRPAVDGSTVAVVIDRTDLVPHTHLFGNVPSTTVSYYAFSSWLRKHAATSLPFNFVSGMGMPPATVTTYTSGSFADNYQFGASVDLDRDGDGKADATVGVSRCLRTPPADLFFDFSLAPVVPGNLAINPGGAGRPVISWSNNDSRATVQTIMFSHRETTPQRKSFYYSMTAPASAASLVYPELPDILAAFRPAAYSGLSLSTMKFDSPVRYDEYLKAITDHAGRFYEAAGLSSYSNASVTDGI